jgi:hypothetical protein
VDTIMTLAHVAFNFSVYSLSTDLRAVSMTCDLRAEQRKGDSGKKYERKNSGYDQRRGSIMTRAVL